jgi:aryl-alcohol dehydrogenase-like predicted oxidoreductase
MQQRLLPGTDLSVSEFCLGAVNFGNPLSQAEAFAVMDTFIDAGGNFLDTARVYCDWLPNGANISETMVGAWQKARGSRDKVIIATKGAHPRLNTMHIARMSPAEIQDDIEASLKYLQTDVIDIYWLHRDDVNRPAGEILETMNGHIKAGDIRYIGCSNWTAARIQEAQEYAAAHNIAGFVANQPMWSLAEPNRENINDKTLVIMGADDTAFHEKTQMPVMPYTSQGKGFFQKFAAGQAGEKLLSQYDNALNRTRLDRIRELAQRHKTGISAIVLSYLTSQAFPVFPIISASNLQQLQDSTQFAGLRLSADEVAYLRDA